MGWIGCIRCKQSRRDIVTRTFALIAPVHPVLHKVSCSYETIPNATKHYEMHQNMRIEANRIDRVCSLQQTLTRLRGTKFCINCTSSPRFAPSSCSYETIPNAPKHYESHQNMSLGSNGVDQVRLLGKITTWLRGTNICINCTSSVCFAPSFIQLQNDPKCTQILQIILKHCFRVQWGG